MLNLLKKADDILEWIENWIMVITGVGVCGLIVSAAFMRYVLSTDFYGYEELTLFCAFWLYFMGSSVAAKKDTHINANMITLFSHNEKIIAVSALVKSIVSLFVCALATYWCFNYVTWSIGMGAKSNVFKLPNAIAQIPMLISFVMWTLYLIRDVIKDVKHVKGFVGGKEGA